MTIAALAHFYVYLLEPALKIGAAVLAVLLLLQVINLFSGKDKKFPWVDSLIKTTLKSFFVSLAFLGKFALWFVKIVLKNTKLLIDTMRDFFTSKI